MFEVGDMVRYVPKDGSALPCLVGIVTETWKFLNRYAVRWDDGTLAPVIDEKFLEPFTPDSLMTDV